ncbi:MAG: hypothetical protein VX636_02925 [Cyanobacteriota bacterium]|nr:hypothetical protein [Cyanobacteriota bacterium]MEC9452554.1 hypothetical protein [Cyanobacteriota bacterium]MED5562171.1 hypothetical protein [Cyanobacteriota bacterium]
MMSRVQLFSKPDFRPIMDLHQGDCVQLLNGKEQFQVIGIDDDHNRCWVRRWPLLPNGSPVFEVSMQHITCSSHKTQRHSLANL